MAKGNNTAVSAPGQKQIDRSQIGILNESSNPAKLQPGDVTILQNYVYEHDGGFSKRTGSGPYGGAGSTGSGLAIKSGVRWYQGQPSVAKYLVVQSGDELYVGNDTNGTFTSIGSLVTSSTPAYFCSAYDPAESGVGGTPASDILIIAYGTGAPKKWDGTNFTQLSSAITNHFIGCTFWHNHVWFWGDPSNPGIVFATDINNPEAYTFSTGFGGYQIGPGDGDPLVQRVIGIGPNLFVFKGKSIWVMNGYDFAAGNYQFTLVPQVEYSGTCEGRSVARLKDKAIYYDGAVFKMIDGMTGEITPVGETIQNEEATAATAGPTAQGLIRAAAGTFQVAGSISGQQIYEDVYLCAIPDGTGTAATVCVYDDVASRHHQRPCWSIFKGWTVGCFIPWVGATDMKTLYWGDGSVDQVNYMGQNNANDSGSLVTTTLQFLQDNCDTPFQTKWLDYIYLLLDATGTTFNITITSDAGYGVAVGNTVSASTSSTPWGTKDWGTFTWGSSSNPTLYQNVVGKVDPWLRGHYYAILVQEANLSSVYSYLGHSMHTIVQALPRG